MTPDKNISNLVVERKVDQKTGEPSVFYLLNGTLVSKIDICGAFAERLSGLSLIQKDLTNAKQWALQARQLTLASVSKTELSNDAEMKYTLNADRETYDHVKGLFVAALVFYGKAFTEAAGRKAQVERDWLSAEFRDIHDYYMSLRHNFAAHSGDLKFEYARSSILLMPEGKNATSLRLVTNRIQPDAAISMADEEKFEDLIDHVMKIVDKKYEEKGQQIIKAALDRGLTFWTMAYHANQPVNMDDATLKYLRKKKSK